MTFNPQTDADASTLLEQLGDVVDTPFESATPIPPGVNHSRSFFELEQRQIFQKEWICVGREDEIAEPGDFMTHEIAGVPVLVVRNVEGDINAFINACAHRFACLVPEASGSVKKFTCRYHAWTYDTSGHLIAAPYTHMKAWFNLQDHKLAKLHHATWEGFLYVTLNPDPMPTPAQRLTSLSDHVVGRYGMPVFKTVIRDRMVWNANWKNLIENFTESYHVPMAHGKTFAQHEKPLEEYICGEGSDYYCYHRAAQAADTGLGAAHPDNERLEGEWRRMMIDFCVFPCQLVTLMPDYVWWISVQPDGVNRFIADWGVAMPPEVLADVPADKYDTWLADFKRYMDVANEEDKVLVQALFQGSGSPVLPKGTYHPIERNLWQFARYLRRMCRR